MVQTVRIATNESGISDGTTDDKTNEGQTHPGGDQWDLLTSRHPNISRKEASIHLKEAE